MNIDSLIFAQWVIPIDGNERVLQHHALAINDDKIIDLLPADAAKEKYQAFDTHQLDKHVLIPGLINCHTHAAMSLFRGLADDLPLMDWLNKHIWPAEQKWVSQNFVIDGTRLAIAEMIRGGTTCFNDMYFFPDQTANVAIEAGMRAVIGLIMLDFPTPWAKDPEEYFDKGHQIFRKYGHSSLIQTIFAPHAPYTVSDQALQKIAVLAEEIDIQINIHLHETAHEIEQSLEQHGKRPLERLNDLGLLSPRLLAIHMTQLELDEIETVARHGVHVIHCPESNLKLASGFCPVYELQQAGVNLAIGTDGAASNNDLDMLGEMQTTALLGKGVASNSSAISAYEVLEMSTIQAAKALAMDDKIGSLSIGKQADITAIKLDEIETQPLFDPISQIVYATSRNQVTDVWVAGKQLLKERELQTIDENQVKAKAMEWALKFCHP